MRKTLKYFYLQVSIMKISIHFGWFDAFNLNNNFELKINWEDYYGDYLEINLEIQNSGWLTFVDNWDPYWAAYINENEVKVEKLFKTINLLNLIKDQI